MTSFFIIQFLSLLHLKLSRELIYLNAIYTGKMFFCTFCAQETNYRCISCQKFICNWSLDCHVPVAEGSIPGWQIGRQVAVCHPCDNISNILPSKVLRAKEKDFNAAQGMLQFEINCASRGFHVYCDVWNLILDDRLEMKHEYRNVHGPFAISISAASQGRLTDFEINWTPTQGNRAILPLFSELWGFFGRPCT